MNLPVFYFSLLIAMSTYTYLFKEDFTKEVLDQMLAVAIVLTILITVVFLIF